MCALHGEPGLPLLDLRAGGDQLVEHDVEVVSHAAADVQVAARDGRREDPGAGDDPVGHGGVLDGVEPLDTLDLQGRGGDAVDAGTHRDQHLAQVDDLGLAGHVVDDGGALRHHRCHHQVLGRPDRREVEPQVGSAQAAGHLGDDLPVLDAYDGTELLQPEDVHVQAPRADRVTTGQGHARAATSGDERTEHGDRCPQASYQLVGGLVLELLRHLDRRPPRRRLAGRVRVAGIGDLDGAAELAEQLAHHRDVEDVRHVVDHRAPGREQRAGHQLQRGVLGPADVDRPGQRSRQRTLGDHTEAAHAVTLVSGIAGPCGPRPRQNS